MTHLFHTSDPKETAMTAAMTARITASGHCAPATVDAAAWTLTSAPGDELDEELVVRAGLACRDLPIEVDEAIVRFASASHRSGALLIRRAPIGDLPPTPATPESPVDKDLSTEFTLLTVARRLGEPVGYVPEHGGRIVQNIVPTRTDADRQTSTSSRSNLMFHTETAFHPFRPRYLLLLCLRGDPSAHTTLASVHELIDLLPARAVDVMFQPRFRTAVDASFLAGRANELGPARPLVTGTRTEPTFVFDADLTIGVDPEAEDVLVALRDLIEEIATSVVLEPGDLLVVDNDIAVHGRSPFSARFDGTDRWLQRSFVVADLAPSAGERDGRVLTTRFGREATEHVGPGTPG
jgi:L-asparagine oxygenase